MIRFSFSVSPVKKIKGISTTTIVILIAETNGFENFDDRAQLTSFAGYDVVHNQSGETLNGKTYISKKGNRSIRRALYLPAISVVKYEPHFKALYKRVYETSKIKMKGYVAVQENCSLQYLPYLKIIVPSFLTLQRGREKKKYPIRSL